MTTQSTTATFLGRSGKVYTFEATSTDNTTGVEMLSGPSPYAITAQSLGDYAQNDVLVAGLVSAQSNCGVSYISYGGEIVSTLPIAASNVSNMLQPLKKPIMIKPGMVLNILTNVKATTQYYLAVETANQSHVFAYTSTGAGTGNLVSITTQQNVGRVLRQPILCAYVTGPLDNTASPNGVIFVNGQGNPVGYCPLSQSASAQPMYSEFSIPIDLNTVAQVVADA